MPTELNSIKTYVDDKEKALAEKQAAKAKLSLSNYLRKLLGFTELKPGRKASSES